MKRHPGLFIVLEGPDKCGKSTQARLLAGSVRGLGYVVEHTREPGGTSFAEEIRRILLSVEHRVQPLAELLLYEAARAQHTEERLRPALAQGKVVICERYTLSTTVYQGYARGLDQKAVGAANRLATGGLTPDLTFVLDIPDGEFAARDAERAHDRLENEPPGFRRRVRAGYRKAAVNGKAILLNGKLPIETIQKEILQRVRPALKKIARPEAVRGRAART